MYFPKKNKRLGFALVEILVACSIISVALVALVSSVYAATELSRRSVENIQAGFLLEEGAEVTKIIRDNGWSGISSLTIGTNYYPTFSSNIWSLSTTPNTLGIFTRTVVIDNVYRDLNDDIASSGTLDTGMRKVTETITWNNEKGLQTKTLTFYIGDLFS